MFICHIEFGPRFQGVWIRSPISEQVYLMKPISPPLWRFQHRTNPQEILENSFTFIIYIQVCKSPEQNMTKCPSFVVKKLAFFAAVGSNIFAFHLAQRDNFWVAWVVQKFEDLTSAPFATFPTPYMDRPLGKSTCKIHGGLLCQCIST